MQALWALADTCVFDFSGNLLFFLYDFYYMVARNLLLACPQDQLLDAFHESYSTSMASEKSTVYLPIEQCEEREAFPCDTSSTFSWNQPDDRGKHHRRSTSCRAALPWLLHIIFLSISISFLTTSVVMTRSAGRNCITKLSEYCKPSISGHMMREGSTDRL